MGDARVGGIILAAGTSSRMGSENKLVREWNGKPLVRHVYDAASRSKLFRLAVVTGHEREAVEACLPEDAPRTHNGDYANGMAGSIRAGSYRLQGHGPMMILLGDMPLVMSEHINSMIDTYMEADSDKAIIAAACNGDIGNPVLFGKAHFVSLKLLEGDRGGFSLLQNNAVIAVEIGEAARRDFDTPEAFEDGS